MTTYCNKPMNTRDTVAWVHCVLWCAKIQYCTCVTRFGNTTGLPIPMVNPTYSTIH